MIRVIQCLFVLSMGVAVTTGCTPSRPTVAPLASITDLAPATGGDRALIVFLPGSQEMPRDLVERGFVAAVRARNIAADVQIVDSHVGYFYNRTIDVRLREDVILPARARGYRSIWIAGISLGGLGSLIYASTYPGEIDGVIALAPYIARPALVQEVMDAGGLRSWQPPAVIRDQSREDFERRLLAWLKGYGEPGDPGLPRPPLYIGYGLADGFAVQNALIGDLLPPGQLRSAPGGHTWLAWNRLWGEFLDQVPLPRLSGVAPG